MYIKVLSYVKKTKQIMHIRVARMWQDCLYHLGIKHAHITYELYTIGAIYLRNRHYVVECNLPNGIFCLSVRNHIVGYILIFHKEVKQIFNASKQSMDYICKNHAFYVDNSFILTLG